MNKNEPIPDKDFKVLVRCFTFNQSKYIENALNGFSMQKTTFSYICIIVDDCSTDGEQDVIRRYLNKEFDMNSAEYYETEYAIIIKANHNSNKKCTFCVYFLKYNHYSRNEKKGKYLHEWRKCCDFEALCEGDDYWIDPNKLQDQIDILENHSDVMLVCSDFETVDSRGNTIVRESYRKYSDISVLNSHLLQLLKDNYIMTMTCCFRSSILDSRQYINAPYSYDYTLFLTAALLGRIVYITRKTSVYRFSPNGLMATARDEINLRLFAIREYFFFEIFNHLHNYNINRKDIWKVRITAVKYGLDRGIHDKCVFLCRFLTIDIISVVLVIPLFVKKVVYRIFKKK